MEISMELLQEKTGILYGIGVGPGEPELLTYQAVATIESCQTILFPSEPIEDCYAYQITKKLVPNLSSHPFLALPLPMTKDEELLKKAQDEGFEKIEKLLTEGQDVAFLTIGDPAVYSTFLYLQNRAKEKGYQTKMISGIPSFCAVAARLGISLGEKEEQIHIIPGSYEIEETKQFTGTRIYMKSGKSLEKLKEMLQKEQEIRPLEVYGVSNCGMENECVTEGVENLSAKNGYLTIVIVKNKTKTLPNSSRFFENRACSYYPCHKEIEQLNCMFCYCPMYRMNPCPGKPEYWEKNGKTIKVCTNCTYPHQPENYDNIMKILSGKVTFGKQD